MVNKCESLINVVIENKPKVLGCSGIAGQSNLARVHRLGPKGKGSGIGVVLSPITDVEPPVKRRNLTHAYGYLHGTWQPRRPPQIGQ
jgi:hypothetical protein